MHACAGRESQATTLLVGNVASALKVLTLSLSLSLSLTLALTLSLTLVRPCAAPHSNPTQASGGCSPVRIEFRLPQVPLQVHGAQSAVTEKVMDELVSHGVSRATVTLTRTPTRTPTQPGEPWRLELRAPDGMTT